MKFVEIGKIADIPSGGMKTYKIEGQEILVVNHNNSFFAIGRKCTHFGGDLSKGTLEGSIVTCPRHGSQFDVTNGKRLAGPAKKDIPVYPVKTEGEIILVGM
jgi:3-phenylpropionate/trans-cinnamate dioxygenase ferredoxin subunit